MLTERQPTLGPVNKSIEGMVIGPGYHEDERVSVLLHAAASEQRSDDLTAPVQATLLLPLQEK